MPTNEVVWDVTIDDLRAGPWDLQSSLSCGNGHSLVFKLRSTQLLVTIFTPKSRGQWGKPQRTYKIDHDPQDRTFTSAAEWIVEYNELLRSDEYLQALAKVERERLGTDK